jgi:hypothetical protein
VSENTLTLGDMQKLFVELYARWLTWALSKGYRFSFGEAKRSDEQAEINVIGFDGREFVAKLVESRFPLLAVAIRNNGKANGIRNTAHGKQLGIDMNAFKNGRYLGETEEWKELGEYWESLHPLCRWGGRFGDGNHLSLEFQGVK